MSSDPIADAAALLERGDWQAAHGVVQAHEALPHAAWAHGIVAKSSRPKDVPTMRPAAFHESLRLIVPSLHTNARAEREPHGVETEKMREDRINAEVDRACHGGTTRDFTVKKIRVKGIAP